MSATHLRVVQQLLDADPVDYAKLGIVGDGATFEMAGMANLANALATYDEVKLEGRPQMLLGETFVLSDIESATLTTGRVPSVGRSRQSWPGFLWDGPAGGTMILLDRCRNMTLDGFGIATDDFFRAKAPASVAIALDGGQDTNPESHAFGTTCTISRCRHVTYPDPDPANPLGVAATFIDIAERTKENQEFHEIVECGGNGNGRGIFLHIGPSYNAKGIKLYRSRYIDGYDRAVLVDNGYVTLEHNNMNGNEWDLWLGAGAAAVGYVTEVDHIGENSRHHAFVNMPFAAWGSVYDHSKTRLRSEVMQGLPTYSDEPGPYEEAWIMFGGFAEDVSIERCTIGSPPDPNTRLFGWMADRSTARYELGPFKLGPGHTKRTLGIDTPTLRKTSGKKIYVHTRANGANANGPGPADLKTGELVWNSSSTTYVP